MVNCERKGVSSMTARQCCPCGSGGSGTPFHNTISVQTRWNILLYKAACCIYMLSGIYNGIQCSIVMMEHAKN